MRTILSNMGINHTMSTAVHSSPTMYTGMGVPELWLIQSASKHKLLLGHLHKSDLVGNNLCVELDCLQLQAGTSMSRSCLGGERAIICIMVAHLLFCEEKLSGDHTNICE